MGNEHSFLHTPQHELNGELEVHPWVLQTHCGVLGFTAPQFPEEPNDTLALWDSEKLMRRGGPKEGETGPARHYKGPEKRGTSGSP